MRSTLLLFLFLFAGCATPVNELSNQVNDAGLDDGDKVGPRSLNCTGTTGEIRIRFLRSDRYAEITSTWGSFEGAPSHIGNGSLELQLRSNRRVAGAITISNYYGNGPRSRFSLRYSLGRTGGAMTCTAP